MIEHFEKEKAHKLLSKLFEHSQNIIISTPLGFMPQNAWAGNQLEIHKSGWELKDFAKYKVIEHKIVEEKSLKEILEKIPGIPAEMKTNNNLLVLWIRKK